MECVPRDENYISLNASQLTDKMIDDYRSCLSSESFKRRWPVVSYLVVLTVVGFFSDAVVITVYSLKFRDCASRVFVLAMAVCDITTSAVGLPLQVLTIRYSYDTPSYWLCRVFFVFATLPTQASGLVLTAVAVDRFHRVWRPHSRQLTARQCVWVNVVIIVLACVIFGCFVPLYGIHHRDSHIPGVPVHMCWTDNNVIDTPYLQAYGCTVNVIFYGSLLTMVTCYALIGVRVWRMSPGQRQKKMGRGTPAGGHYGTGPATSPGGASSGSWTVTSQSADKTETLPATEPVAMDTDRDSPSPGDDTPRPAEESGEPDQTTGQSVSANSNNPDQVQGKQNKIEERDQSNEQGPEQKCGVMFSGLKPEDCRVVPGKKDSGADPKTVSQVRAATGPTHAGRVRNRTTLIMFVLTVCYILNWLPHNYMRFISTEPVNWCDNYVDCGYNFYALCLRSYYISSAVNGFVYSFICIRFRNECVNVAKSVWRRLRWKV